MTTKQLHADGPEIQTPLYSVALSLDAFLVNGIPYGVIHGDAFDDFLLKPIANLRRDLDTLAPGWGLAPWPSRRCGRSARR